MLTIGRRGSRNGQFNASESFVIVIVIVRVSDGSVYAVDSGNGHIKGFSPDGLSFKVIDRGLAGKLGRRTALTLNDKVQLLVMDRNRSTVTVY
ncbi:MAG: hypothetical protein ACK5OI_06900 [Curvibacter sp.]